MRTFFRGPEVPRPSGDNGWPGDPVREAWRRRWADAIDDAVRYEDAWGLLCTAPNCDVTLRDVLTDGSVWAATEAFSVHLLLARETPRESDTAPGAQVHAPDVPHVLHFEDGRYTATARTVHPLDGDGHCQGCGADLSALIALHQHTQTARPNTKD